MGRLSDNVPAILELFQQLPLGVERVHQLLDFWEVFLQDQGGAASKIVLNDAASAFCQHLGCNNGKEIAQTNHPLQPHLTVNKELFADAGNICADARVLQSPEAASRCLRLPTSEICSSGASPSLSATRPRKRGLIVLAANSAEVEAAAAMTGVPPIDRLLLCWTRTSTGALGNSLSLTRCWGFRQQRVLASHDVVSLRAAVKKVCTFGDPPDKFLLGVRLGGGGG